MSEGSPANIKFIEIRWTYLGNEDREERFIGGLLRSLKNEIWTLHPNTKISFDVGNKNNHFYDRDDLDILQS